MKLTVWRGHDRVVGTLWQAHGALLFRYREGADPREQISASLPVDTSRDLPGTFFSNLLPDGVLRERLAQRLGVSVENDFAMLAAVGGDCAGALALLPEGGTPAIRRARKLLTPEALRRACEFGSETVLAAEKLRLSLAGAQDKIPVVEDEGKLYLPVGVAASTHILKLPSPRFRGLAYNELLVGTLATEIGLQRPAASLWRMPGKLEHGLLIARFDRGPDGTRIHQEDMCQALGLPPSKKYEADEGPTLARIVSLLSTESSQPAQDIERIVRWQAFNALIGNADGHAKNLALIREPGRVRLAPFYDLVCTRQWDSLSKKLAFSVGGVTDPGALGVRQWTAAAKEWELSPKWVLDIVRQTGEALRKTVAGLEGKAIELGASPSSARVLRATLAKLVRRSETLLRSPR